MTKGKWAKKTAALLMSALIVVSGLPVVSFAADEESPQPGTPETIEQTETEEPASQEIALTGISLNKAEWSAIPGKTMALSVTYTPADTTADKTVTWTTSDKTVAAVDAAGKVTTKKPGTATITAKVGDQKAVCKVTVKKVPLKTLTLSKKKVTLNKGKTVKLSVKYTPSNTTVSKKVTWSSSNKKVATVSKTGKVTAKKAGKATISAKMGGKKVTCKVTVKVPLKSIKLDAKKLTIDKGKTCRLHVKYSPTNTTTKKVTWRSSNKKVATVDKKGKITAKKRGTAVITATCGGKKASCKIKVVKPDKHYKNVEKAYKLMKTVRAMEGVGYWNPGNKSATVFNTNSKNKLPKLKRDLELEQTARIRAKEISKLCAHIRPNGTDCSTAYPKELKSMGENIFWGPYDSLLMMQMLSESDQPYEGQGHRRNILNPEFNAIGIACYERDGTYYWVQCFGER